MVDPLELPEFLRRPALAPEEMKKLRARLARRYGTGSGRKIKNPPKKGSRRSKRLGMAFGAKVRNT